MYVNIIQLLLIITCKIIVELMHCIANTVLLNFCYLNQKLQIL